MNNDYIIIFGVSILILFIIWMLSPVSQPIPTPVQITDTTTVQSPPTQNDYNKYVTMVKSSSQYKSVLDFLKGYVNF